eukprot:GHRR01010079.1.p1 GENE.GHRR01010079.1~~GHRR01010079.1.p1  ORF type:complete len:318 (+),score=120.05 GHRR01010079.1:114-1067(+)
MMHRRLYSPSHQAPTVSWCSLRSPLRATAAAGGAVAPGQHHQRQLQGQCCNQRLSANWLAAAVLSCTLLAVPCEAHAQWEVQEAAWCIQQHWHGWKCAVAQPSALADLGTAVLPSRTSSLPSLNVVSPRSSSKVYAYASRDRADSSSGGASNNSSSSISSSNNSDSSGKPLQGRASVASAAADALQQLTAAQQATTAGDYQAALRVYSSIVHQHPDLALAEYARVGRAFMLYQTGQVDEALIALEDQELSMRGYPEVHAALAAVLYAERPPQRLRAEQQFDIAVEFDAHYQDAQWVAHNRHWPPALLQALQKFLLLQ